jgi:hypothetical protein
MALICIISAAPAPLIESGSPRQWRSASQLPHPPVVNLAAVALVLASGAALLGEGASAAVKHCCGARPE